MHYLYQKSTIRIKMKKAGFIAFFSLLILAQPALARSGCCSHHSGVRADGCGCNDGTPLSSTCAPYYICERTPLILPTKVIYPTSTPIPTNTPTPIPTTTPMPTVTPTPKTQLTKTLTTKKNIISTTPKHHRSFWDWLFGWNK